MAVGHVASATSGSQASVSSFNIGTLGTGARAGIVFVVTHNSSSDIVTGVTWNGVSMTLLYSATDTDTEPGRVEAYFLDNVTNGTITVSRTNNSTVTVGYAASISAGRMCEVAQVITRVSSTQNTNADTSTTGTGASGEVSVDDGSISGTNSLRYAAAYTGAATPLAQGTNSTALQSLDSTALGSSFVRETTAGTGSRSVGFATGTTDDYAAVFVAVRERTFQGTFTANSVIKKTTSSSFTANAVIVLRQTGSFTANAIIKKPGVAKPTIVSTATSNSGGNVTSYNMTIPTSGLAADMLYVAFLGFDGGAATDIVEPTLPDGWLEISPNGPGDTPTNPRMIIKRTTGSETSPVAIPLSASEAAASAVFLIRDWDVQTLTPWQVGVFDSRDIARYSVGLDGTTATPNPPSLNALGSGDPTQAYGLWLAAAAWDGNQAISSYPSNMPDDRITDRVAASTGAGIAAASLTTGTTATFDPDVFTIGGALPAGSLTVHVRERTVASGSFTANAIIKKTVTSSTGPPTPDGTWANNTQSTTDDFRGVTYGGGYWLAVGNDGSGLDPSTWYATDPTGTWTRNAFTEGTFLSAAAYNNGTWVAVGTGSPQFHYTSDLSGTWTHVASGSANEIRVIYQGSRWIVSASDDNIGYKTNPGDAFTQNNPAAVPGEDLMALAYGDGYFVTAGIGGALYYTTDITTAWTGNDQGATDIRGVAYGNGYWTAVGSSGLLRYKATDPTGAWTANNHGSDIIWDVHYANGYWVAVGNGGLYYKASTPVGSWTLHQGLPAGLLGVYATDRDWVTVGGNGSIYVASVNTPSITVDSVIRRTQAASLSADAVIAVGANTVNGSFTADAVVLKAQMASFTADAVIRATISGSCVANAVIKKTQSASFSSDAVLKRTISASFTTDAVIKRSISGSYTADAVIKRTIAGSFTADAYILNRITASFTADAIAKKTNSAALAADAIVKKGQAVSLSADAIVKATIAGSFSANAVIRATVASSFTANAVILRAISGSFASDAVLKKSLAFSFTSDAIARVSQDASFSADAITRVVGTASFSADAAIARLIFEDTFTRSVSANQAGWGDVWDVFPSTLTTTDVEFSVDGSVAKIAHVSGSTTRNPQLLGYPVLRAGIYQFDRKAQATDPSINFLDITVPSVTGNVDAVTMGGDAGAGEYTAFTVGSSDATVTGISPGDWLTVQVHTHETNGTPIVVKIWKRGDPEPHGIDATSFRGISVGNIGPAWLLRIANDSTPIEIDNFKVWSAIGWQMWSYFTANAIRLKTQTGSFAADAVIKPATVTVTADAVIRTTGEASFTASAFVAGSGAAAFSADAILKKEQLASVQADAVLRRTYAGQLTQDAIIKAAVEGDLDADAVIFKTQIANVAYDAVIKTTQGGAYTADACVLRVATGQFSADAYIEAVVTGSFDADAVIKRTQVGSLTTDAFIAAVGQAVILADAVVKKTQSATYSADAVVRATQAANFTANAVVKASITQTATADAVLKRTTTGSYTANAFIEIVITQSFTADATTKRTQESSFTASAFVAGIGVFAITADAVVKRTQAATFTADAILRRSTTASFTTDAIVKATVSASFSGNAVIRRTTSVQFTSDAVVRRTTQGSITADAWLIPAAASFTSDAVLRRTSSVTLTADAVVRSASAASFTANAVIRKTTAGALTANAVIISTRTAGLTAHAVVRASSTATFTADAYVKLVITGAFTADASITSSITKSFVVDAVIGGVNEYQLDMDAVILGIRTEAVGQELFATGFLGQETTTPGFLGQTITSIGYVGNTLIRPNILGFTADAVIV